MSFQRITTIGSIPPSKSDATASRLTRSPSFSSRWISTSRGREVDAGAQARAARRRPARTRRRGRRRAPAPAPSAPRCGRGSSWSAACSAWSTMSSSAVASCVAVAARIERAPTGPRGAPPLRRWMMSWVIRSPSCSQRRSSRASSAFARGVDEDLAQEQRLRAARRAAGLLEQVEQRGRRDVARTAPSGRHRTFGRPVRAAAFTACSHAVHTGITAAAARPLQRPCDMAADLRGGRPPHPERIGTRRRPATASLRALGARVRPARRAGIAAPGRIVRREELYRARLAGAAAPRRPLRRRLRAQAAREARAGPAGVELHPHARRLRLPLRSPSLHTTFTTRSQADDRTRRGAREGLTCFRE